MTRLLYLFMIALMAILAGCGTQSGKYYDKDGPPSGFSGRMATEDAVPRVERPANAANRPYRVMGKNYYPQTGDRPMVQVGYGSWYGKQFHGKKTSTGEIYDMYEMTAAHTTMELPSYARVTNLENGKTVIVRVNDRGPFLHERVIDLSYAAAHKLGYANKGTARVKVERLTREQIAANTWRSKAPVSYAAAAPLGVSGSAARAQPVLLSQSETDISPGGTDDRAPLTKPQHLQDHRPSKQAQEAGRKFIEEGVFTVADGGGNTVEDVRMEMAPMQAAGNNYVVQLGSFKDRANAEKLAAQARREIDPQLVPTVRIKPQGGLYKVVVGKGYLPDQARSLADDMKGRLGQSTWIVRD
jgi:rare lipoprotein A